MIELGSSGKHFSKAVLTVRKAGGVAIEFRTGGANLFGADFMTVVHSGNRPHSQRLAAVCEAMHRTSAYNSSACAAMRGDKLQMGRRWSRNRPAFAALDAIGSHPSTTHFAAGVVGVIAIRVQRRDRDAEWSSACRWHRCTATQ